MVKKIWIWRCEYDANNPGVVVQDFAHGYVIAGHVILHGHFLKFWSSSKLPLNLPPPLCLASPCLPAFPLVPLPCPLLMPLCQTHLPLPGQGHVTSGHVTSGGSQTGNQECWAHLINICPWFILTTTIVRGSPHPYFWLCKVPRVKRCELQHVKSPCSSV